MYKRYDLETAALRWRNDLECDYVSLCAFERKFWKSHLRWRRGRCANSLLALQCVVWYPAAVSPTLHDKAARWNGGSSEAYRCNGARGKRLACTFQYKPKRLSLHWSQRDKRSHGMRFPWALWLHCAMSVKTLQVCSVKMITKKTMVSDLYGYCFHATCI